jgi:CelD/BcsL family acetyltransferase involved in cellulose biosynthesis
VLVVLRDKTPVGILPLIVAPESTRLGRFRLLTYPLRDWATFYGPIGPCPATTLLAGLGHVLRTPRRWDLMDLRSTDVDTDRGRTPWAMRRLGHPVHASVWKISDVVELQSGWDEYLASRSGKFRHNLRRNEHRAHQLGRLEYGRYRPLGAVHGDTDPQWSLYDECVELSARTRQGSVPWATTLSHEAVRGFFRDVHAAAARCGSLDVNTLHFNGRLIAFTYNYHFAGAVVGVRMGFDPEYASISPGSLLLAFSLRDGAARGDKLLDLGTDRLSYKRSWRTRCQPVMRYVYYPAASPRAQLLRWKRQLWPTMAQTNRPPRTCLAGEGD